MHSWHPADEWFIKAEDLTGLCCNFKVIAKFGIGGYTDNGLKFKPSDGFLLLTGNAVSKEAKNHN